jgi:hypothetical protein
MRLLAVDRIAGAPDKPGQQQIHHQRRAPDQQSTPALGRSDLALQIIHGLIELGHGDDLVGTIGREAAGRYQSDRCCTGRGCGHPDLERDDLVAERSVLQQPAQSRDMLRSERATLDKFLEIGGDEAVHV